MSLSNDEVVVAGAGPTGLMLATVLAEAGIGVRMLEQKAEPSPESRAAIVHVRTLQTWEQLGLTPVALAAGIRRRDPREDARGDADGPASM